MRAAAPSGRAASPVAVNTLTVRPPHAEAYTVPSGATATPYG
jgi:hypothetical protein